jgi:hypothetical protein
MVLSDAWIRQSLRLRKKEEAMKTTHRMAAALLVCACGVAVQAEVTIETVTIGNPGDPGEWAGAGYGGFGPDRICGGVD